MLKLVCRHRINISFRLQQPLLLVSTSSPTVSCFLLPCFIPLLVFSLSSGTVLTHLDAMCEVRSCSVKHPFRVTSCILNLCLMVAFFSVKPFILPCYWQITKTAVYIPSWPRSSYIHAMQGGSSVGETESVVPSYSSGGIHGELILACGANINFSDNNSLLTHDNWVWQFTWKIKPKDRKRQMMNSSTKLFNLHTL